MDLHTALLVPHIAAGTVGLVLGPFAVLARRDPRLARVGRAYLAVTTVMTTSAVGLVALAPGRLWYLGAIAVVTEAVALAASVARARRRTGWLPLYVQLLASSYLSFVTAFLVVTLSSPLAWALPTIVGSPLIALEVRRARRNGVRTNPVDAVSPVDAVGPVRPAVR